MADIQKLNVNNTTYDISTTWAKVTGKPTTFPPDSHTHSYLPLSGGTLTGMTTIRKSSTIGDAIYWVETTNSNHYLGFGEGTSGNRGIYDRALGWVFKIDTSNNVTISGTASNAYNVPWSGVSGKPTTISGYGITDAYTSSTIDSKLSGYLPLSGGTISGALTIKASGYPLIEFKAGGIIRGYYGFSGTGIAAIWDTKDWQTLLHSGNYNSYAPTLTGTGASGTWG